MLPARQFYQNWTAFSHLKEDFFGEGERYTSAAAPCTTIGPLLLLLDLMDE